MSQDFDTLIKFFETHPVEAMKIAEKLSDESKMLVAFFACPKFAKSVSEISWKSIA